MVGEMTARVAVDGGGDDRQSGSGWLDRLQAEWELMVGEISVRVAVDGGRDISQSGSGWWER